MAHDVFISYAARDKATADAACATLEGRRIRCWIAPRDVLPGTPFPEALIDAISRSRIFVLVFSSGSNESPQVMREVERAVSKGIPVIPLRIEDVPLSKAMEYLISTPHWLDALTPPLERHLQRLADTIEVLLAAQAEEETDTAAPPPEAGHPVMPPARAPAPWQAWPPFAVPLVLLAVLAAGVAIGIGLSARRPATPAPAATLAGTARPAEAPATAAPPTTEAAPAATATPPTGEAPTAMATDAPPITEAAAPTLTGAAATAEDTPAPLVTYRLPFSGPQELICDGAHLWARFDARLVRLELVAGEGRFRAGQQVELPDVSGLAWAPAKNGYWAVRGREVALLDPQWKQLATFALPEGVDATFVAFDGSNLWTVAGAGPLYKLAEGPAGSLQVVDSYAAPAGEFAHRAVMGLTWDGERLWVLVDDVVTALDSTGQPVRRIVLPSNISRATWYGWRGLAWDGRYLWAAHTEADLVCRVDPFAQP